MLSEQDCENLVDGYKFLRRLENKLRLVHDQSINQLTSEPGYLAKLARHLGYAEDTGQPEQLFKDDYTRTTQTIRDIFERVLNS